ncbi:hypothetical protein B0H19DRAFT_1256689 [Mycena capillaripes]|nr:hypothetical protein B0H19DRAFT_1256689 [Mycena capillaripes]
MAACPAPHFWANVHHSHSHGVLGLELGPPSLSSHHPPLPTLHRRLPHTHARRHQHARALALPSSSGCPARASTVRAFCEPAGSMATSPGSHTARQYPDAKSGCAPPNVTPRISTSAPPPVHTCVCGFVCCCRRTTLHDTDSTDTRPPSSPSYTPILIFAQC